MHSGMPGEQGVNDRAKAVILTISSPGIRLLYRKEFTASIFSRCLGSGARGKVCEQSWRSGVGGHGG